MGLGWTRTPICPEGRSRVEAPFAGFDHVQTLQFDAVTARRPQ